MAQASDDIKCSFFHVAILQRPWQDVWSLHVSAICIYSAAGENIKHV